MWKMRVIDTWNIVNNNVQPKLVSSLLTNDSLRDVSGEPVPVDSPHVTPVTVEIICGNELKDYIESSKDYGVGSILWIEEIINDE